ncbi:hypothetical protein HUW46_00316 [Amycolatopsis sp. CA-230715]|nr:hypothetical protein HUW46_00316 [Amycolatopsis sp. CA-230715]
MVWTPTAHAMRGDEVPALVLRELDDGRRVMLVYSSAEAFAQGCGTAQPYVTVVAGAIQALQHAAGADDVLWDAILHPAMHQRGEYTDDGVRVGDQDSTEGK